jgi:integrase
MFPQVRAMVLTQFYAGMRPGEVVAMRRHEVNTVGPEGTWIYCPEKHKGTHRGQKLAKVIGSQGQEALASWLLKAEPEGYVFPPVRDRWGRGHFRVEGYYRSICEACQAAGVERFTPYQLRHLAKQIATREFGLDAARAYLGQLSIGATALYAAQQDLAEAVKVAKKIG